MFGVFLVAAVVFAQAAPAAGAAAGAAPPASTPPASTPHGVSGVTVTAPHKRTADPNEIICHREPVLGSLFPKEVCARREDLIDRQRVDQASTRHIQEVGQIEVLNPADKR